MTRSVPHHLRRCSCGRGVSVPGPARTCAPRPGRTSARGRTDRSRSCRFTHGPLPAPFAQVRSLVEGGASERSLAGTDQCEGLLTFPRYRKTMTIENEGPGSLANTRAIVD